MKLAATVSDEEIRTILIISPVQGTPRRFASPW
jgi:hypothetical protein